MSFLSGLVDDGIKTGIKYNQSQFIEKYGSYADDYPLVTPLGKNAGSQLFFVIFVIFAILSLIVTGITFGKNKKQSKKSKGSEESEESEYPMDSEEKYEKPKRSKFTKTLLIILLVICLLITAGSGVLSLMKYLSYSAEYNQWYYNLPQGGKLALGVIKSMEGVLSKLSSQSQTN